MPEQIKEVTQLRGLNIRQEAADVEEPEVRAISNLDPFREPGVLAIRKGRQALGGPLSGYLIRGLSKVGTSRYQVAGRRLYRDFQAIQTDLAKNEQTQIQPFRPLNDHATWAFVADDDWMMKDHGSTTRFYLWGIEKPLLPGPKVANQTGKTAGDTIEAGVYTIAVTQLRYDEYTKL